MGKLIPIVLALVGLGAGMGAGIALRPAHDEIALNNPCGDVSSDTNDDNELGKELLNSEDKNLSDPSKYEYMKLTNQFVIPIIKEGIVNSLVVIGLSLEIEIGSRDFILTREPRLRDYLLRVIFDHANSGGFDGEFTKSGKLDILRSSLREAAQNAFGPTINDVLILDIVRQDT